MDRRVFTRLCGGLLSGAAGVYARGVASDESRLAETLPVSGPYPNSLLMLDAHAPVTVTTLAPGQSLVFSYPYVTTPCFLVRLSAAAPGGASWPGGVGPDQSLVAFSAICSHKLSHPARPISHLNYRSEPVRLDMDGQSVERGELISCCSERSVYDPASGASVLTGPAPEPLAAIELQVDDQRRLHAVASLGPDQYDRFLGEFGFRLAMEYGVSDVRARVGATTLATPAEQFSQQRIRC